MFPRKPEMKTSVRIAFSDKAQRIIYFYSTEAISQEIATFGDVDGAGKKNMYNLTVDARYDYDEVIKWINALDTFDDDLLPH